MKCYIEEIKIRKEKARVRAENDARFLWQGSET